MAGGGPTYTSAADAATRAQRQAAARLVWRKVTDPAGRSEVLQALGLEPYSDPRAGAYQALAAAIVAEGGGVDAGA